MMDDLISRKSLLECAEYDDKGRLVIPYRKVKNAPTAFDKEKVIEELRGEIHLTVHDPMIAGRYIKKNRTIEIVEKGGIE